MDASFWQQRWADQQIGFHEAEVHPMLVSHGASLGGVGRVFVPLCGKSNDMAWLRVRGHEVVGIELAELAVRAFFDEHGMGAAHTTQAPFEVFSADGYRLLCGDYFALTAAQLGDFGAVYDRAALIALPPEMRRDYAKKMSELCASGTSMLLVTVAYDASVITPPPFVVSSEEVTALYGQHWTITPRGTRAAEVKGQPGIEQGFVLARR
jgi:thiopurine S-methyltransferase